MQAPTTWRMTDGTALTCPEKLRMLAENHDELAQVMLDAFEDAILMGVDPAAFRALLHDLADSLRSPHAP